MSYIVAEELRTELVQDFELTLTKNYEIEAIKLYIFCYNSASISGTFRLSIFDGAAEVGYNEFNVSDIIAQGSYTTDYFRTWYPVIFDNPIVLQKGYYTFKLSHAGYTYSGASFISWCREHENEKVNITYVPENDLQNPLSYEIYTRIGSIMTRIVDIDDGSQSNTPPSLSGIGWTVKGVQTVSDIELIEIDDSNNFQYQPLISDGGQVDSNATPFGTTLSDWSDGVVIRLIGTSDTDYMTILHSDIQYGVIMNGDTDLLKDVVVELQYDSVRERFIQILGND